MSGQPFWSQIVLGVPVFPLAWTLTDREVISHFVSPSVPVILALLYLHKVSYYHIWTLAFSDHLAAPAEAKSRAAKKRGRYFANSLLCAIRF